MTILFYNTKQRLVAAFNKRYLPYGGVYFANGHKTGISPRVDNLWKVATLVWVFYTNFA